MPNPLKLALTGPLQLPLSQSLPKSVASTSPRTSLFFQPMPLPLPCTGDLFSMTITQIPPHIRTASRKDAETQRNSKRPGRLVGFADGADRGQDEGCD